MFYIEHPPVGATLTTSWLDQDEILNFTFDLLKKDGI